MNLNDQLLTAIRSRGKKQTEFGYGIQTADVYVRTLAEQIGIDSCYKHVASRKTSFDDMLQKAGRTLVYSNPDMEIEEKDVDKIRKDHDIELPKNTLMVFRHTLTSSNKDRDGDVLHASGAKPDPKMLMLFQHLHNMPIGKAIAVADQTDEHLKMISCIVDINEISHDSAVMVDNGMGRFSHGFRAIDFDEIKEGDKGKPSGSFDIKEFEIMEESLVSVPANIDATTEEVMLSLVEGGKLTSPVMKVYGKTLRDKRPVSVPVSFREIQCNSFAELKEAKEAGLISGAVQEKNNEQDDERHTAPTSEETGETTDEKGHGEDGKAEGTDEEMKCPKCGGTVTDGKCSKCGYVVPKLDAGKIGPGGHVPDGTGPHGSGAGPGNGQADGSGKDEDEYLEEKADEEGEDGKDEQYAAAGSKNVKCPKCGYTAPMNYWSPGKGKAGYKCPKCKADMLGQFPASYVGEEDKDVVVESIKQGRMISKANEARIQDAVEDLREVGKMPIARPAKALVKSATSTLVSVLKQLEKPETQEEHLEQSPMSLFVASSTPAQRKQMKELLETIERSEQRSNEVKQYRGLFRGMTRRAK